MTSALRLWSVLGVAVASASAALAGPTSHAMELANDGSILFVDLDRERVLKLSNGDLTVYSELNGVPGGDHLQNLVLTVTGELYLGEKKSVWRIDDDGSVEKVKPPAAIKALFTGRPGDLAPDGSVYVARDFRNIERALPGGDAHPVLATDNISKIHSMTVTPYGRVFYGNGSEVAKLDAKGEVSVLLDLEGQGVLGLAAENETQVLVLRRDKAGEVILELVDSLGNTDVLLTGEQIAASGGAG